MTIAIIILCLLAFVFLAWRLGGKGGAEIVAEDNVTLSSQTLRLTGRPDRIIKLRNGTLIPVEKKNSRRIQESHRVQLGVYFLLMEEIYGARPPYGFVALADDGQVKVVNTHALRKDVKRFISELRSNSGRATPFAAKCKACGVRSSCTLRA